MLNDEAVSIPFKREGVSKAFRTEDEMEVYVDGTVSIPFKREGVSKGTEVECKEFEIYSIFRFPSNGKAYPKRILLRCLYLIRLLVSIPFKREGVSKGYKIKAESGRPTMVSIPFKREGVSKGKPQKFLRPDTLFQFPSNGKVYPK